MQSNSNFLISVLISCMKCKSVSNGDYYLEKYHFNSVPSSYVLFSNHTYKLLNICAYFKDELKHLHRNSDKVCWCQLSEYAYIFLHQLRFYSCCSAGSIGSIHLFCVNKFRLLMPQTLKIRAKQIVYPILGNGHILTALSNSNSHSSHNNERSRQIFHYSCLFSMPSTTQTCLF